MTERTVAASETGIGIVAPKQVNIWVDTGFVIYTDAHGERTRFANIEEVANFWSAFIRRRAIVPIDLVFVGEACVAAVLKWE